MTAVCYWLYISTQPIQAVFCSCLCVTAKDWACTSKPNQSFAVWQLCVTAKDCLYISTQPIFCSMTAVIMTAVLGRCTGSLLPVHLCVIGWVDPTNNTQLLQYDSCVLLVGLRCTGSLLQLLVGLRCTGSLLQLTAVTAVCYCKRLPVHLNPTNNTQLLLQTDCLLLVTSQPNQSFAVWQLCVILQKTACTSQPNQ